MKYDICYYRNPGEDVAQVGQIKRFYRMRFDGSVKIKIQPLSPLGGSKCECQ